MKNTLILCLLVLAFALVTPSPARSSYIEDPSTSEYYYWGSTGELVIHNCTYGNNYSLQIGTNLDTPSLMETNWTASLTGSYVVRFKQINDPFDSSKTKVSQLQIDLYENNSFIDSTYFTVMYYDWQWEMDLLAVIGAGLLIFLIIGSLMIAIVKYFF